MAIHSRKELEKQLEKSRRDLNDARTQHESTSSQLAGLQDIVNGAHEKMQSAKNTLMELTDHIHNMDLSGAHSLRDRGDVKTYLIDKKEYKVEKNDVNDVKLIPWKEFKSTTQKPKEEDENDSWDAGYSFASAFKLLKK